MVVDICQMFVEMIFVVGFFFNYVLWETEGLVERSFFFSECCCEGQGREEGGKVAFAEGMSGMDLKCAACVHDRFLIVGTCLPYLKSCPAL